MDMGKNTYLRYPCWDGPETWDSDQVVGHIFFQEKDQQLGIKNRGILNLIRRLLGVGLPLHKPYPYSLYRLYIGEDSSSLGTNEMFGDKR